MSLKNIISTVVLNYLNEAYVDQDNSLQDMEQGDINEILKGYIEAALWTEEEELKNDYYTDMGDDEDSLENLIALKDNFNRKNFISFMSDNFDDNSKIDAYVDIKTFIRYAGDEAIQEAINENGLYQLGIDIWLTRNGHGSGFFNYNYENEDILMNAAKKLKEKSLYIGDDGKLHFM